MKGDFFLKDVIDHQRNRIHGEVLVLPKFSHTLMLSTLLVWVTIVVVWLISSTYARKETVLGWLDPPNGVIRIYSEGEGTIKSILVKEGDAVHKNQPLIIINDDRMLASGDNLESKLRTEYETQSELLKKQLNHTNLIYAAKIQDIHQRISASESEQKMLYNQTKLLKQRHELIKIQVERQKTLRTQGHVSLSEYDNTITQELTIQSELQGLTRAQITQKNLTEQLYTELSTLPNELNNQIDQILERLSSITQQITQLSGQRAYIVKAPKDGVVSNLQIIEGQLAKMGESAPLMTITPINSELTVHLLIPVRAAGFVAPNQLINIRYDAFPYEKFGLYRGKIVTVSKTLLLPNELLNAPVPVNEPVYRVTASLSNSMINAYGKDFPLKPGMTLSADVVLGERSLLQWLLEPIYSLQGNL